MALQVKLLQFLQDHSIERVGGRQQFQVDARIIAATNIDLKEAVVAGRFREDLYYRLEVVNIQVPPLRDRGEDVMLLAYIMLKRFSPELHKPLRYFAKEAIQSIKAYHWPGNVRELMNKIRRG